ncbi:hypothetical protein [Candidatus Tisiphia endosymbiont of Temnostethus pusillus]|uniref:hypothetical protein n=1 Tax=Candidatus Tisiphia endosymbiont of Temnostethus pusillus TaxID=3139335 RepID=UPI0035C9252C
MQILFSLILMLSIQNCYADISLNSSIQYAVDSNTKHQYLEGAIPNEAVEPYLKHLKTILSPKDYKKYTQNQQKRDAGKYHITIVRPDEYKALNQDFSSFIGYPMSVRCFGIGNIKEGDNETYFLVCQSQNAANLRQHLKLPTQNFHVTLGYKETDIFDRPKDKSSLIPPYSILE